VRECVQVAREVDAAARTTGAVRLLDLLAASEPGIVRASRGCDSTLCLTNAGDEPARLRLEAAELGVSPAAPLRPLLGSRRPSADREGGRLEIELAAHESALVRLEGSRRLAVFCDFDGTFSIQDVGSTLARLHIPERRQKLWGRYESGELSAWEYTHALLDGFPLPESDLDAFLRTVELDPGSHALVAWCEAHGVPFRILSDGFDRNLISLQAIHDVRFDYSANRLAYEHGVWRIAPGHPSATCGCGTGTCKGTIISDWRAAHPEAFCVHIGNGRVSDLCGARAADLTFARISEKDTLAPALDERGEHYVPFETLLTVVEDLARLISPADEPRPPVSRSSADANENSS
jgi:2,3-diketo-5-methylthio-1-phosphopentane phosphatase